MATDDHLERDVDQGYYVNEETGEFLGVSPEGFGDVDVQYVKVVEGATYSCPQCGYEGNRFRPLRYRPTIEAPLHRKCPRVECNAELSSE